MSGFLYFLPNLDKPVELADCERAGLGYAFDRAPQSSPISGRTPSGTPGMLVWDAKRLGSCVPAYRPAEQTWRRMPRGGTRHDADLYLGMYRSPAPGPETLARELQLAGEWVKLADGREWLVPRLRFFSAQAGFVTALPVRADLDDEGHWIVGEIDPRFQSLDKVGARLYEAMVDGELGTAPRLTPSELLDIAAELLCANYCVSRVECAMLRLLSNDDLLTRIARVAMDWQTALEWAEKKSAASAQTASAGSTTSAGDGE